MPTLRSGHSMRSMERFPFPYWIIYYLAYLIAAAALLWQYWGGLQEGGNTRLFLLAAIFGTAAGTAITFTILTEGGVRLMLLIPAAVRKIKQEGRKERDARYREAVKKFGVEEDGVKVLRFTPEVQEFLSIGPGQPEK